MAKLDTYKRKRDFKKTPEPKPSAKARKKASGPPRYMIHKHAATRLHYDLRLEMDGALASWAIPKGPTYDPAVRRYAVQTEDHPLAYGDFEGRIPEGEYGAGDSMIWDKGVYETLPPGQASAQRKEGHLSLVFQGEKLKGHFHLIQIDDAKNGKPQWLFFKAKDADARPGDDLTAERPESVVSGRRIARGPEFKKMLHAAHPTPEALLKRVFPPMLATLTDGMPAKAADYRYELKYDGFRGLAGLVSGGKVALLSRNGLSLADRFPKIAAALEKIVVSEAVIDGEVVALDDGGVPRFSLLQEGMRPLVYFAFDLLWLDGEDLRARPLEDRRELLESLLSNAPPELQLSLEVRTPKPFLAKAKKLGFEGLIAKRKGSPYEGGRSKTWLKLKVRHEQELAIVGYEPSTAGPKQVGSLLLAYAKEKALVFAGGVGTGFTDKLRGELYRRLSPDRSAAPTATGAPRLKTAVWVTPRLVAQVAFSEWTSDGRVRQAAFLGLRDDKAPGETRRE